MMYNTCNIIDYIKLLIILYDQHSTRIKCFRSSYTSCVRVYDFRRVYG